MSEETPEVIDNPLKDIKLFSKKTIWVTTLLCGPLAPTYLIAENFKALGNVTAWRNTLIIGLLANTAIFVGLFMTPDHILNRIPSVVFSLIYTVIAAGIAEHYHGKILNTHKELGNAFHSGWRAAGIGAISLLIVLILIAATFFLGTNFEAYDTYNEEIVVFTANEDESLNFYDSLETRTDSANAYDLTNFVIPKWEENIAIIHRTNKIEDLPDELGHQNEILLKYAELRLEAFQLMEMSLRDNTFEHQAKLDSLHMEMNLVLEELE